MTTQEHIDGLIATIWSATQNRSVTNVMVARVLDWLNRRSLQLQLDIEAGRNECRAELLRVREQMEALDEFVKGVNTVASNAYGKADGNTRAIEKTNAYIWAILRYLETGQWPEGWESGGLDVWGVRDTDRGQWQPGAMYYNGIPAECDGVMERSHVWYFGCKFVCLRTGTADPPRWNSPDWAFEEGDPEFRVAFAGGPAAVNPSKFEFTLTLRATLYNQDVTADVLPQDVVWSRYSKDINDKERTESDAIWGLRRGGSGLSARMTEADIDKDIYGVPPVCVFTATVTLRDGTEGKASLKI